MDWMGQTKHRKTHGVFTCFYHGSDQKKAEDRLKIGIPSADFHPQTCALAQTVANSPYLIDSAGFLNSSFVGNTWCPDAHGVARIAVSLWFLWVRAKNKPFLSTGESSC